MTDPEKLAALECVDLVILLTWARPVYIDMRRRTEPVTELMGEALEPQDRQ